MLQNEQFTTESMMVSPSCNWINKWYRRSFVLPSWWSPHSFRFRADWGLLHGLGTSLNCIQVVRELLQLLLLNMTVFIRSQWIRGWHSSTRKKELTKKEDTKITNVEKNWPTDKNMYQTNFITSLKKRKTVV